MKRKFYIHQDCIIPVIALLTAVFFLWESGNIAPASAAFPRIMGMILSLFSLWSLRAGVKKSMEETKRALAGEMPEHVITWKAYKYPSLCCAGLILYAICVIYIGYFVSTFLFMTAMMYLQRCRKWAVMVLVTVCTEVIIYVLFVYWLGVRLPHGFLF